MYSEEETELRDLVMQNLESCGFLNKIKAELRAGVFLALEEDGNLKNKIPLFNQKFDDFINTSEGKLIISLIREFLEFFNLNFTLSVFDPEVATSLPCLSRAELCDRVNLRTSEFDGPVILTLLKEVIGIRNQNFANKSSEILNSDPEKSVKTTLNEKEILEDLFNSENSNHNKEKIFIDNSFEKDDIMKSSKDKFDTSSNFPKTEIENNNAADTISSDLFKEKADQTAKNADSNIFKDSNDILSPDPFFDEPLPSEKTSFFAFSDPLKDKSESKTPTTTRDLGDSQKTSLSSLKDLPSLATTHEWTFSRDPKNALPSLDSLKSVSSSEASNEEIINLDSKEVFEKKDSDIVESNEESSEKQNSEESIEEEIDESSAVYDDLLNSSLSLGEDVTTDQTVSQISIVESIDHLEPVK